MNDETADFERRIDLVLARSATPGQIVANRAEVTGDELSDRDPVSKLWPSDHAGVVVELRDWLSVVLDALSPQRRRLVLGAGGLVLLLIITLAVIAVVRVAVRSDAAGPANRSWPGPSGAGVRGEHRLAPAAGRLPCARPAVPLSSWNRSATAQVIFGSKLSIWRRWPSGYATTPGLRRSTSLATPLAVSSPGYGYETGAAPEWHAGS